MRIPILISFVLCSCGPIAGNDDAGQADASSETDAGRTTIEIYYDDGSSEIASSLWGSGPGSGKCQRMTAPQTPVSLTKLSFYVTDFGTPATEFEAKVYSEASTGQGPGAPIATIGTAVATAGNEWVDVITEQDLEITTADFFACMIWLTAPGNDGSNAQLIGMDISSPDRRTWYSSDGSSWQRIENIGPNGDQDAMIRATVSF